MAVKTIRTKPFRIALSGSTIDGRKIDDAWIKEIVQTFNLETYQPRVNIEHIRGISAEPPFQAYGDVVAVEAQNCQVDFGKGPETRLGLFAEFEFLDNAKKLNDAGQKVFTSMEVEPDWFGTGLAGLAGVAMTDSPASAATQRLVFSRSGDKTVRLDSDGILEFVEEMTGSSEAADGFFSKLTELLGNFTGKPKAEDNPAAKADDDKAPAFDPAAFATLIEGLGKTFSTALAANALVLQYGA